MGAFLLDEGAGGLLLGMHRIGGDHASGDVQGVEQVLDLGDLVGFLSHFDLSHRHPLLMEEGREEMDLGAVFAARPAQRLAIDGQGIVGVALGQ